jgi:hypothetical protein
MEFLALGSFALLVVAWVVAPSHHTVAMVDESAAEPKAA